MIGSQFEARLPRHPVTFTAQLQDSVGGSHAVMVENFSVGGCCVRHFLRAGELVSITLPRMGRFEAEVRWGRLGRAGLRFRRAH